MINKNELCTFLVKAKKITYAAGDSAKKVIEDDNSTTLVFEEGDWKYNDNYFGGEPFGGREVAFFDTKPVYLMVYYGRVNQSINNFEPIYKFLQEALKLIPKDKPYRGPNIYEKGNFAYLNQFIGDVDNFSGEEKIIQDGKEIYSAKYIGGLINRK